MSSPKKAGRHLTLTPPVADEPTTATPSPVDPSTGRAALGGRAQTATPEAQTIPEELARFALLGAAYYEMMAVTEAAREAAAGRGEPVYRAAVDSGQLLVIDPCYLSREAQAEAADHVRRGLAVPIGTNSDGWYAVKDHPEGVLIRPAPPTFGELSVGPGLIYAGPPGVHLEADYGTISTVRGPA